MNVRVQVAGREVQWTLRDTDEDRLADRLARLLTRYPAAAVAPRQPQGQGETPQCKYHGPMKASTKAPGTFFCTRKIADGSYCPSRFPEH